ncbi:hypothetical protein G7Y89_g15148 [Cudoniella acicularis]|uniref:Uncharacterized protein n=1 Tax=Cudoniella acicularis TaxID=354080 RepID=A0A8H4VNA8_9HELO|nr:hypothetical protein G7Y89_g15148 [Cudoniella acicularis]
MTNTIIITGANGSLAIPTVDHLLQHSPDSTLVLTVRDASDGDANTSTLRGVVAKHPGAHVSIRELDLSHLPAVHDFARGIATEIAKGSLPQLTAIVGTAFYWNLVSYLSHFALVLRLIKSFRPEGGRIVLFTSDGHEPGKNGLEKIPPAIYADPTQLDLLVKPAEDASLDALGHGFHRYANSKLALVMFTHALNRRLQRDAQLKDITTVVMNPGNLADSRALLVNTPRKLIILSKFVLRPLRPLLSMMDPTARTVATAGIDVARLATNETHPGERGYFTLLTPDQGSKESQDETTQEALWSKSVQEHEILLEAHEKYGPIVRWQPNMLLINDPTMLPKIYHLRANKTPHYNHSPSDAKGMVEENDWQKHRAKRHRIDLAFSPKSIYDNEALVNDFIAQWISALRTRFAATEQIFDFSDWGNYLVLDIVTRYFFGQEMGFPEHGDKTGMLADTRANGPSIHGLARLPHLKMFLLRSLGRFLAPTAGDGSGLGNILKLRDDFYEERLAKGTGMSHIGLDIILSNNTNLSAQDHEELKEDVLFVM